MRWAAEIPGYLDHPRLVGIGGATGKVHSSRRDFHDEEQVINPVLVQASMVVKSKDEQQQVPWLKRGFRVPRDARFRSEASGIAGTLSRAAPSIFSARAKTRRHKCLRLG